MELSPQPTDPAALQAPDIPPSEPAAQAPPQAAPVDHPDGLPASIASICGTIVIAIFVITFIVQAFQIPSESMENTLLIGDYLLVDKTHYGPAGSWGELLPYTPIRRGDVIVFRYPVHPSQHFVKRVIGVPGDHVRLVDKRVFVNGRELLEPYTVFRSGLHDSYRDEFPDGGDGSRNGNVEAKWYLQMPQLVHHGDLVVPRGMYFVLGDNRDESLDSRYWGLVPRENIVGRPLLIYWSMNESPRDSLTLNDRISRLLYTAVHVFQQARWKRVLRLVN